jgi:hypothetical protein
MRNIFSHNRYAQKTQHLSESCPGQPKVRNSQANRSTVSLADSTSGTQTPRRLTDIHLPGIQLSLALYSPIPVSNVYMLTEGCRRPSIIKYDYAADAAAAKAA